MNSIYLNGSEDIRNAGHSISSAASEIAHAANIISEALYNHQRYLDDWLDRFKAALEPTQDPKQRPDPNWCYFCDRPKNDCACEALNPSKEGGSDAD